MANLEVGDVVLCTVDKIEKANVFVKIENNGEGSIVMSEIASGRIRNLRDYVVPKKKIVCKVLRISGDRIELSLRRVTGQEQKRVMENYKLEQSYKSILKTILKEKTEETIQKIEEKETLSNFIEEAKENSKELEKVVGKSDAEKILEILTTQKQKKYMLKKEFSLTSQDPEGIIKIKKILEPINASIKYISAGKYSVKVEAENIKAADQTIQKILEEIQEKAKAEKLVFNVKEK